MMASTSYSGSPSTRTGAGTSRFPRYGFSRDALKTGWTIMPSGKCNLKAFFPIYCITSYGPIHLGFSLPWVLSFRVMFFVDSITWSPTLTADSRLALSARSLSPRCTSAITRLVVSHTDWRLSANFSTEGSSLLLRARSTGSFNYLPVATKYGDYLVRD